MRARNKITAAPTDVEHSTLYIAIEISRKSWVVGLKSPAGERIGLHPLGAADVEGLKTLIEHHRAKAKRALGREMRVLCCYEAGYEGFWLTRWLELRIVKMFQRGVQVGRQRITRRRGIARTRGLRRDRTGRP